MSLGATRLSLAASAAFALIAGAAILPASAQTATYPEGTDCTNLVGNSKTECEHQSKNTSAPDNANNPSNQDINNTNPPSGAATTTNSMPSSNTYAPGADCSKLVGNSKEECARQSVVPDNSNNPDQND